MNDLSPLHKDFQIYFPLLASFPNLSPFCLWDYLLCLYHLQPNMSKAECISFPSCTSYLLSHNKSTVTPNLATSNNKRCVSLHAASEGQECRSSLAPRFWLWVAVQLSTGTQSSEGLTGGGGSTHVHSQGCWQEAGVSCSPHRWHWLPGFLQGTCPDLFIITLEKTQSMMHLSGIAASFIVLPGPDAICQSEDILPIA